MRSWTEALRIAAQAARTPATWSRHAHSKVPDGALKSTAIIPNNEYGRKAVIYRPSGPSAQYGYDQKGMNGGTKLPYKIWLPTQETWENPLMGWASSSDVASSSFAKMSFGTVEQAADFLRKVGMEWTVDEKPANFGHSYRPQRYQGYGDNFSTKRGGLPDLSHLPSMRKKAAAPKKTGATE